MKIYKVTFMTTDKAYKNVGFSRTHIGHNLWDIIVDSVKKCKEKKENNKKEWVIDDIRRIK